MLYLEGGPLHFVHVHDIKSNLIRNVFMKASLIHVLVIFVAKLLLFVE